MMPVPSRAVPRYAYKQVYGDGIMVYLCTYLFFVRCILALFGRYMCVHVYIE